MAAYSLFYLYTGFDGLTEAAGTGWALAAVVLLVTLRFLLPLTIGAFLCASEVWHWHWAGALVWAAPGLAMVLPGAVAAAFGTLTETWRRGDATASVVADTGGNGQAKDIASAAGEGMAPQDATVTADRRDPGVRWRSGILWLAAIAGVVSVLAFSIEKERAANLKHKAWDRYFEWIAECPRTEPPQQVEPAAAATKGELFTIDAARNAPTPVTAWERSEAMSYLKGNGPRPDIPCEQRGSLQPI
jgi:hypothetical protein